MKTGDNEDDNSKEITIEVPGYNSRDVEFLQELKDAHNHDSVENIGAAIERTFTNRVTQEFMGQDITPKTRADITDFCTYLLSIAKFYGYNLPVSGLIASVHGDTFSIRTQPSKGISTLVESTFTYFDEQGNYKLTARGFMRRDWVTAPDDPVSRRLQIARDNNDVLPGATADGIDDKRLHIHVEIEGHLQALWDFSKVEVSLVWGAGYAISSDDEGKVQFFDDKGKFYLSADGQVRQDWARLPNHPTADALRLWLTIEVQYPECLEGHPSISFVLLGMIGNKFLSFQN